MLVVIIDTVPITPGFCFGDGVFMIPFLGIRKIPPGSFRKATLSRKNLDFLRVLTLGQSVFDPGVTGSKHMGDTSTRLVRFPTLIVPEQAGHSVASVVTAVNALNQRWCFYLK